MERYACRSPHRRGLAHSSRYLCTAGRVCVSRNNQPTLLQYNFNIVSTSCNVRNIDSVQPCCAWVSVLLVGSLAVRACCSCLSMAKQNPIAQCFQALLTALDLWGVADFLPLRPGRAVAQTLLGNPVAVHGFGWEKVIVPNHRWRCSWLLVSTVVDVIAVVPFCHVLPQKRWQLTAQAAEDADADADARVCAPWDQVTNLECCRTTVGVDCFSC